MPRKPKDTDSPVRKSEWPKGDQKSMSLPDILYEVQQRLTVPKDRKNDYGDFMYRTVEQINRAVKKILADYPGTVLRYHDEITSMGGWRYVRSTCSLERGDERVSEIGYARESEHKSKFDDAQLTGSASSYARKYAAQALFAIDGEPDPDEHNADKRALPTASNGQGQQRRQDQRRPNRGRPAQRTQGGPAPMPTYQTQPNGQGPYQRPPWEQ